MKVKPIRPEDIMDNLADLIPNEVFQAVNNLLKINYRGKTVVIKQDEIIDEIIKINPRITREEIFDKKYLDFEKVYRENGWSVFYDKPAYSESYKAFFKFSENKDK